MPKRQRPGRRQTTQSNTYRFFVSTDVVRGRDVISDDEELAHQFVHVLRLQADDEVVLLDNSGWQYTVTLTEVNRGQIRGKVVRKELASGEPRTKVILYTALMRAERFEWVLQKGTELGVTAFVPLLGERSTLSDADSLSERKLERWQRIIREAAEQCRRGKLPRLTPPLFWSAGCEQASRRGPAVLLWEGSGATPLRQTLQDLSNDPANPHVGQDATEHSTTPLSLAVFSGPEGGLAQTELELARGHGIIPVTLGPRTLRAETAPLVAAAAILYQMGDLD